MFQGCRAILVEIVVGGVEVVEVVQGQLAAGADVEVVVLLVVVELVVVELVAGEDAVEDAAEVVVARTISWELRESRHPRAQSSSPN